MIIFKGKKRKYINTMDITLNDIRAVFLPLTFNEKYKYLGRVPWKESGEMFQAMEPLVIFMDSKAKPWWCPRFILRLLHLFGDDNSIVRVRNRFLSNLKQKITKGYTLVDYKTKWEWYDLRLSVYGTKQMNWLADAIEDKFYRDGKKDDLKERLKKLNPQGDYSFKSLTELEEEWEKLQPNY